MNSGTAKDVATVVAAAGELVGRTRLQKTMVMLELAGLGFGFEFDYHLFGPFSEDLVNAAERASALRYIQEIPKRSSWGGIYSIFKAEKHSSGNEARDQIVNLARDADSIVLELAATAAFLANIGVEDPWNEVSLRKPEKITRARLSSAKELYAKFLAIETPVNLPQF